jgi:hypothetical protein
MDLLKPLYFDGKKKPQTLGRRVPSGDQPNLLPDFCLIHAFDALLLIIDPKMARINWILSQMFSGITFAIILTLTTSLTTTTPLSEEVGWRIGGILRNGLSSCDGYAGAQVAFPGPTTAGDAYTIQRGCYDETFAGAGVRLAGGAGTGAGATANLDPHMHSGSPGQPRLPHLEPDTLHFIQRTVSTPTTPFCHPQ